MNDDELSFEPEPEPVGTFAPTRPDSFALKVERSNRHPVLLFGTGESGKSTLLISLLRFLAENRDQVNVTFGARMFDRHDEEAERYYERAQEFYERYSKTFTVDGEPLPATFVEKPFFVPVDIRLPGREPLRLAFLETMGDWIATLRSSRGPLYPELRPEIVDLLKHFGGRMSVIYVAPYSFGDENNQALADSDLGLNGCIGKYQQDRKGVGRDFLLYVLTKWDRCAEPLNNDTRFRFTDAEGIQKIIQERYAQSWATFRNLPLAPGSRQRFFMQYSAGHIVGDLVRKPPPEHQDTFERYPRTLLNWIYGNAIEASGAEREVLFADVMPPPPVELTFKDRVLRFLGIQ